MKEFAFTEMVKYVPRCIICEKEISLSLSSFYRNSLQLIKRDDYFVSKQRPGIPLKDHKVILSSDGTIIKGYEEIDKVIGRSATIELFKKCRTCDFAIYFRLEKTIEETRIYYKKIPNFYIALEHADFYQKLSKYACVYKIHKTPWEVGNRILIKIDNKHVARDLPFDTIDFNKIKNLKHMNRVLNMIKTFQ